MQNSSLHAYSVVVIDDSHGDLALFEEAVKESGYQYSVVPFLDPTAALEYLKLGNSAHLILTDLNMPTTSGINLVNAIRGEPTLSKIPIAIFSSRLASNIPLRLAVQMNVPFFIKGPTWTDYLRLAGEIDEMLQM